VKLTTYSINNISKRLDNLLAWLAKLNRTWLVSKSSKARSLTVEQFHSLLKAGGAVSNNGAPLRWLGASHQ
jgi:hypothetical protein